MSSPSRPVARLVRVTVTSQAHRVDVALPSAVPVADLLPDLARCVGLLDVGTVHGGYRVVTRTGRALQPNLTLGAQNIAHGEVISIVAPDDERPPEIHDDASEAVAAVVERDVERWGAAAAHRTTLWSAVVALLLGAAALASEHAAGTARMAGAAAAAVAVALLTGTFEFSNRRGATVLALVTAHLACLYAASAALCWTWRTSVPGTAVASAGGAALAAGLVAVLGMNRSRLLLLPVVVSGTVCSATGLLMRVTTLDPALPATTVLTLVVLVTSAFPALALSTAGAGRHALADGPSTSPSDAVAIDLERLAADCRLAREILVSVSASAGVLLVLLAPFAVSLGPAGAALPALGSAVVMLRTRRYRCVVDVLVGVASGVLGLTSTVLSVLLLHPDWRMPAAAVTVIAGVVLLGRSPCAILADPHPGRVGDWIESATLTALVPVLVVAAGLTIG